LYFYIFVDIF